MLSCDLFETRSPDDPETVSSTYTPPKEPRDVFMNMENAFRELSDLNYVKSFSDPTAGSRLFLFEPSAPGISRYASVLADWTIDSERQYFQNMRSRLPQGSVPSLVIVYTSESLSSDSAFVEVTYELTVPHTQQGFPQTARGRGQFYLITDQARNWVIWRWIDLQNAQTDFTWSEMKGEFGQ